MAKRLSAVCVLLLMSLTGHAESLHVAVTSSFRPVLEALSTEFKQRTGIDLILSSASTGILTQQIRNGAPFDIFFAADDERTTQLQSILQLSSERRATYAVGRLVLVSDDPDIQSFTDLSDYVGRVIIANPSHAPYGEAAQTVLQAQSFAGTVVQANNVSQARQYLSMELAQVGLIAASVAQGLNVVETIPTHVHAPLEQQFLILSEHAGVNKLIQFMAEPSVSERIRRFGYEVPEVVQ